MNTKRIAAYISMCAAFSLAALVFIMDTPRAHAKECLLTQTDLEPLFLRRNVEATPYDIGQARIRRALLSRTMLCARAEAETLRTRVAGAAVPELLSAKVQLLRRLDEALAYYESQEALVANLGAEGVRIFSRDLLSWRNGNWTPLAKTAANFFLWMDNQRLVRAAQNRLDQMSRTAAFLKLIENKNAQSDWDAARRSFAEAEKIHEEARRGLEQFDAPGNTLDLIKKALGSLKETYSHLADLSKDIQVLISEPGEQRATR